MIAVDSSAIVAILARESESQRLRDALERADGAVISIANLLEIQLVAAGRRRIAQWPEVQKLLSEYEILPRPFDMRQLEFAREAAIRFGKGRHKAALNYGDCFAYALAKSEGIALLCTGTDFAATDIEVA